MGWIKDTWNEWFALDKPVEIFEEPDTPVFNNTTEEYDWLFVEGVIKALREKPENFSARWFRDSMENSIISKHAKILFMIDDCGFVSPKRIKPNGKQVKMMKELIKPIIKRDNDYVMKKILGEL